MKKNKPEIWGVDADGSFTHVIEDHLLEHCLKYELARDSLRLHEMASKDSLHEEFGLHYSKKYFPKLNWHETSMLISSKEAQPFWKYIPSVYAKDPNLKSLATSPLKVLSVYPSLRDRKCFDPKQLFSITQSLSNRRIAPDGKEIILLEIDWSEFPLIAESIQNLRPTENQVSGKINPDWFGDGKAPLFPYKVRQGKSKGSPSDLRHKLKLLMAVRGTHQAPIERITPKFFTGHNHIGDYKKARKTVQSLFFSFWGDVVGDNDSLISLVPHRANKSLSNLK